MNRNTKQIAFADAWSVMGQPGSRWIMEILAQQLQESSLPATNPQQHERMARAAGLARLRPKRIARIFRRRVRRCCYGC